MKVRIGQTYALADAAKAHRDLEARRTTGSRVTDSLTADSIRRRLKRKPVDQETG